MTDFLGNTPVGIYSTMRDANRYRTEAEAAAQQAWQDNEVRSRYDEAARLNRAGAISDRDAANADRASGIYDGFAGQFAGLHPGDGTEVSVPGAATPAAPGGAPAATPTAPTTPVATGTRGMPRGGHTFGTPIPFFLSDLPNTQRRAVMNARSQGFILTPDGRRLPQRSLTPEQNREAHNAWSQGKLSQLEISAEASQRSSYAPFAGGGSSQYNNPGVAPPAATDAPAIIPTATPVTAGTPTVAGLPDVATPSADGSTATPTAAGLPADYMGTNDTSHPLQETREMRMLSRNVNDALRRADIAAQHGDRAGALAGRAEAMQNQVAYITQGRTVLYRAAAAGSVDAMNSLLTEFGGHPPGTVRFSPVQGRPSQYVMQTRRPDGSWVTASETPQTRTQIMAGFENLIDAAGAQGRSESLNEEVRARIAAGATMYTADRNYMSQVVQSMTQAQIASMSDETKRAIANGTAQTMVNPQDGSVYITSPHTDAQGNTYPLTTRYTVQNLPTPGTDGHHTAPVLVGSPVTGINGVTPVQQGAAR